MSASSGRVQVILEVPFHGWVCRGDSHGAKGLAAASKMYETPPKNGFARSISTTRY